MNVNTVITKDYENNNAFRLPENKAKTNPTCRGVASGKAGSNPTCRGVASGKAGSNPTCSELVEPISKAKKSPKKPRIFPKSG
jgi:hypothetical protein